MLLRLFFGSRAYGEACCLVRQLSAAPAGAAPTAATARPYSSSGGDDATPSGSASLDDAFQRRVADLSSAGGDTFSASQSRPATTDPLFTSSSEPTTSGSTAAAAGDSSSSSSGASSSSGGGAPGPRGGVHPLYGYAVLGGINPEMADQEAGAQQPKLHPRRNFKPGDTYSPEDLDPFGAGGGGGFFIPLRRPGAPPPYRVGVSRDEVLKGLDFRNTSLLRHFVSESGRLRPHRQTRLPPALHRRVAKAVKLARQMALLPFEMTVGDAGADARSRMQEYEAARQSLKLGGNGRVGREGGRGAGGHGGGSR